MRGIEDTSVLGVGLQSGVGQLGVGYLGVRGESLDTDGVSLDLQFATDKTLTARKGPTPVFTRASSGRFVGSDGLIQSAANNEPRFDHDPITLACKGLLIEESRTNQCYNSNLLTTASWPLTGATITTTDTAPDGSAAFEVTETAATSGHNIASTGGATSTPATSITSGVTYTLSVFAKKSVGSIDWIQITGTGIQFGTAQYANFNLATGAIGNYTGVTSGTVPKMEQFPNGWYRCSITLTATATGAGNAVPVQFTNNTNTTTRGPSYLGSTANKVKVAMGQFEAGSFATSYIPNVASSGVIRSADVCSITGSDFSGMYNATEGSVISQGSIENLVGNNRGMWGINNNTALHGFLTVYGASGGGIISQSRNTAATALPPTFANSASTSFKRGLTYYSGGASISTNGANATDTVVTNSTQTMLTLQIGNMLAGAFYWSGHIASIRYFKKRLSNQKLQTLTT